MKNTMRLSVLAVAGVLFAHGALAADEKIGFVDLGRLMQESTAYQGFVMQQEKEAKSLSSRLEQERADLIRQEKEITSSQNGLSKAELGEKLDALDAAKKEWMAKAAEAEAGLRESREKGLKKIQEDAINPVMKSLAEKHGFSAILNLNMAFYVDDSVNVTDEAVKQVNKKLPKLDLSKSDAKSGKSKSDKKKK